MGNVWTGYAGSSKGLLPGQVRAKTEWFSGGGGADQRVNAWASQVWDATKRARDAEAAAKSALLIAEARESDSKAFAEDALEALRRAQAEVLRAMEEQLPPEVQRLRRFCAELD